MKKILLISYASVLLLVGCNNSQQDQKIEKTNSEVNFQLPTATEIFHLRSECAKMGEKILSENYIGISLTQSQVSKYDPKSNRCYVELSVMSADPSLPIEKFYQSYGLYDGQTKEMIAFATEEKGKKKFGSFKVPKKSYDDTLDYIYEVMNDDYVPKK
jgi:hypothetical protein